MLLAAIRIPIQQCQPAFQHSNKNTKPSRPTASFSWKSAALLLIGLSFAPQTAVHALPGTNHAILFNGKPSLDVHCQQRYASEGSGHFYASPANVPPDPLLTAEPYCFVADTDSFPFVIDTGANRFIVNDRSLFTSFKPQSGLVKGIGGTPVPLSGIGTIRLNLKSDNGFIDAITIRDAVYIPTSPFNLLPPQLLIRKLNDLRYECDMASHSNTRYVFTYRKPQGQTSIQQRLTIPIGPNDLFTVRTGEGYTAFFHEVKANAPEWCAFIGDAHVIPDDDEENGLDSPLHLNLERPREPAAQQLGKTRELSSLPSEKTRELPNSIPYKEGDFQPIRPGPSEALFDLTGSKQFVDNPEIALNRRKQQQLATYHEQLGHVSFSRLQLMAKAGLIPKDLASIKPPVCPGCTYGKAHRKPWRYKGSKNRRTIRVATPPGQVVSVDQLVSPTEGFVLTHRGTPTTLQYQGATIFVDHFSDFTYIHLMTKLDGKGTVEAKQAFVTTMPTTDCLTPKFSRTLFRRGNRHYPFAA
jgi:hypothetical protein